MKFKNTYEFEILFIRCLAFVISLIIAIASLSSCRTTKNIDKEFTKRELSVDSVSRVDSNTTKITLDEKIKENDNSIEFINTYIDTTKCPEFLPSIIYKSDGSFEAIGVRKVNLKSIEWQKKYDSLNNEYNLEINKRLVLEDQLKTKKAEKEKRPVAVAWFLFLVIGFITGFYAKYRLK